jgi:transcriptional regulator with XRE-family HTH domain
MQRMAKVRETPTPVRMNPTEEKIRRNLVRFIAESGYSQNQVADMSGVPQANLGRYVRGESAISVDAIELLADVFARPAGDFYLDEPPPPPKDLAIVRPVFWRGRPGDDFDAEERRILDAANAEISAHRRKKKMGK